MASPLFHAAWMVQIIRTAGTGFVCARSSKRGQRAARRLAESATRSPLGSAPASFAARSLRFVARSALYGASERVSHGLEGFGLTQGIMRRHGGNLLRVADPPVRRPR